MSAPIKIAPKPASAAQLSADGKIVLIQNSKGLQIPLKVVTQQKPGATVSVSSNSPAQQQNNVQVVKNFVMKTNPTTSAAQEPPKLVQASPTKTKFIVKSGVNQQIVLSTPSSIQPQPQKEIKQSIVAPASSIMICSKGIQQTPVSIPTTSSNYHAVNIPGKGMQIVRIVSPKTTVTSQPTVVKPSAAPPVVTKLTTIPTAGDVPKGNQVLIKGKDGQTLTVLQSSSSVKNPIRTYGDVKDVKMEVVKKHPIVTSTAKSEEPPAKKTKYITLTPAQINQIQGATIVQKDGEQKKIVMLPSNYMEQLEKIKAKSNQTPSNTAVNSTTSNSVPKLTLVSTAAPSVKREAPEHPTVEIFDGTTNEGDDTNKKKKRACNCTKSQCLKFYCDCFANGEFCANCNCKDCLNLVDCVEREKAIKLCLERNPFAFKPKITADESEQQRLHVKGCNCKRSGCLKNYCECYEAKISCSGNCKCLGCKNCDDATEKLQMEMNYLNQVGKRGSISEDSATDVKIVSIKKDAGTSVVEVDITKKPYNFMTQDVIEATVQCMIAQGEECQKMGVSKRIAEKMILEEFGRCLVEIIEFSNKNVD